MEGRVITNQRGKEEAFYKAYKDLLGKDHAREHSLNWEALDMAAIDLSEQVLPFTEGEVWAVIKDMPTDRAPSPDGFIGIFFQKAWEIIKGDIMAALHKLFLNNGHRFGRLNQALITLIPKGPDACDINDFRPISRVHSLSKLASKLMATRLRPCMGDLIQVYQSAFI